MRLNEVHYSDAQPVRGYGPGFFRIGDEVISGNALTGPTGTQAWSGYSALEPLLALAGKIDVLFVGTGSEMTYLPKPFRAALDDAGFGIEVMTSPAAARTYNVLLSEGRRVALAMLVV